MEKYPSGDSNLNNYGIVVIIDVLALSMVNPNPHWWQILPNLHNLSPIYDPHSRSLTLTHDRQVKDLKKLIVLMFFVAVSLSDIVQNFWKHIQKAYFKAVLDIFFFYDHPEPRNPSRKS